MAIEELELRQTLGIDDEADPVQAIRDLQTQITELKGALKDQDPPGKEEVRNLRRELSEANQRIIATDIDKNRELLELRQKVHHMEAVHRVDSAIGAGRITPANREIALKVALGESEDDFQKFVRALPSIDMTERGSAGSSDLEAFEPTDAEIAIAKEMGNWDEADPTASRIALMRAKGAKIPQQKKG